MVPVRSVYVNRALKSKEDLIVESEGEKYIIKNADLKHPRISKDVKDFFSSKVQKLNYYTAIKYAGEEKQQKLF